MRACPHCGRRYDGAAAYCTHDGTRLTGADEVGDPTLVPDARGKVFGSYRLIERIGEGGMGRVFLAEHTRLGRKVALKMLKPEAAAHPQAVQRFFAEARAVNRLVHENVVEITDFHEGEGPDDPRYYIMELLHGRSLRAALEADGALEPARAVAIARQLASALGAVHAAGIVHRDLKPDNVFLVERAGRRDFVKLLDFGIARHLEPEEGMARTAAGAVVGTPEYMSPEQAAGSGGVDHRSDVYALGVMLYEMVAGTQPIRGATFSETLVRQMTFTPPPPSAVLPAGLPPDLERLIMSCLEKDPGHRPQSMAAVEAALDAVVPDERPSAGGTQILAAGALRTPAPADAIATRRPPRRAAWAIGLVAAGALAAAAASFLLLRGGAPEEASPGRDAAARKTSDETPPANAPGRAHAAPLAEPAPAAAPAGPAAAPSVRTQRAPRPAGAPAPARSQRGAPRPKSEQEQAQPPRPR